MSKLDDDATAQRWLSAAFNLLTLDTVWTRHLNTAHLSTQDMHQAADVGKALRDQWLTVTNPQMLVFIESVAAGTAQRSWERFWEPETLGPPLYRNRKRLAMATRRASQDLRRTHDQEIEVLTAKIENLHAGIWEPGDLSPKSRCNVLLLSAFVALYLGLGEVAAGLWAWFLASNCANLTLGVGEDQE
ncbi:hypothetical protein [Streptomyces sp. NPDC053367]|uniref:hypothetical protein n=1 Tax=Streptomyces sp. NPDC053367 TaxID=3365700 RepID=UPI0037D6C44C